MSKIYVYLAGPVSNESRDGANIWRDIISNALEGIHEDFIGVNPVRYEPLDHPNDRYLGEGEYDEALARQISTKNKTDIQRADCVLAFLPTLSTGTFLEIGYAHGRRIPVIVVSPLQEVLGHPVVMDFAPWRFDSNDKGFKKALETIRGLFEVYAQ